MTTRAEWAALWTSALAEGPPVPAAACRFLLESLSEDEVRLRLPKLEIQAKAKAEARLEQMTLVADSIAALNGEGVRVLAEGDLGYPNRLQARLGSRAPMCLFAKGNLALADSSAVGFAGARGASDSAIEFVMLCARLAAGQGLTVVTGLARGVDLEASLAALGAGGSVVGYPVEPWARLLRNGAIADALESERLLLLSSFLPSTPFQVGLAMSRNRLIYAHAQCTLVAAVVPGSGGTWGGATEALELGLGPIFVAEPKGPDAGTEALAQRGATRLSQPKPFW